MSPPDDRPEIAPADDVWLQELHGDPAYLRILDGIDLDSTEPGVPAEMVLAWVGSWGSDDELPKPEPE